MEWESEHDLQLDLADYLRKCGFMTFTEVAVPGCENGRVDVVAIKPHMYASKDLRAYEVKLTKQSFYADVSKNKWYKYRGVFHRVYFAIPEGLLRKSDIPDEAGLIVRNDNGWHVVKAPKFHNPEELNINSVLALLYHGYEENKVMRRLKDRISAEENLSLSKKAHSIGHEIARRLDSTKESQIEKWCMELWDLFGKFGFEVPEKIVTCDRFSSERVHLPSIYEIENLLSGTKNLMHDLAAIKAIGKYLENLQYPEESENDTSWYSRKNNRTKALELIG
ncbi:hypothetical protein Cpap_0885 [Ruminiclostridium papyrosolvens DSM 2782]|uniref:MmcB family DNA repair protein n=1 Tax=Ruminiclostridium papyrosolvens DSM 2782 TaxID=588581 RepID=F1TH33_9FIRM|nr:hypothetical protein Cpap_0885 [Ruminiclostridium papyrosolvens DSM 2782]